MILTNGVYWRASSDVNSYFRFFDDGRVLHVSSTGSPQDLSDWFNWHSDSPSRGAFFAVGRAIALTSTDTYGTVAYSGSIVSPNSLILDSYSFINGYIGREEGYEFVEVPFSR